MYIKNFDFSNRLWYTLQIISFKIGGKI